jgi:hypothetical protein
VAVLFAHIEERADVRMLERRNRAGFILKALPAIGSANEAASSLMATMRSRRVSRAR